MCPGPRAAPRSQCQPSTPQVEQCLKRLNIMNLKKSIEDLIHVGPIQKSENSKEVSVPSQPVIEVGLVKILGGCKLLLRLLDCCCTAFLILYRGLLKSLTALYGSLFALLQEVSKIEVRPFIKGFVFPAAINEFLGTSYLGIEKKIPKAFVKKKDRLGWMNKRFRVSKAASWTQASIPSAVKNKAIGVQDSVDIGKPVVGTEFRVKRPGSKRRQFPAISPKLLQSEQLASFVPKIREAHSFEELSDKLRSTISWCKNNKLRAKAFFLGMKLLKSRRLHHVVEAQGCSLPRKLGCVKATICKYLTAPSYRQRPNKILRARFFLQRQTKCSRKPGGVSRRTQPYTQQCWRSTRSTKVTNGSRALSLAQHFEQLPQVGNAEFMRGFEEQASGNVSGLLGLERTSAHTQQEVIESKDDIDDIFGAIGL
ncbi:hypothetical protein lerEdw1_012397 [Lerista edwardsae]|nr:hypothetical protein lerEdw1_012397 [Lerista edwardsae]